MHHFRHRIVLENEFIDSDQTIHILAKIALVIIFL